MKNKIILWIISILLCIGVYIFGWRMYLNNDPMVRFDGFLLETFGFLGAVGIFIFGITFWVRGKFKGR